MQGLSPEAFMLADPANRAARAQMSALKISFWWRGQRASSDVAPLPGVGQSDGADDKCVGFEEIVPASIGLAVPEWFTRLATDLDAADARATALVSGLAPVQLNWKPDARSWSVGQCLEHLCLSNEVYVVPLREALVNAPRGAADEITPGWFARWFIRAYIEPATQKKRGRAPGKASPVASRLDHSIAERFIASNDAIRAVMARSREIDVNKVRFKNPYVPLIRFTIGTGLLIVARHNHRHLAQAERVTQLSQFPGS